MARRAKGEGSIHQRHDHPTCPPMILGDDGKKTRPAHKCKGRWAAIIEDGDTRTGGRRRRTITRKTRREVVDELERFKTEKRAGVTGNSLTVGDWLDRWHKRAERDLSPRTWHVYRGYIDRYLIPAVGKIRLSSLRGHDVSRLLDDMEDADLSIATRRQAYAILRRALQVAADQQLVLENVATRIPRPKVDKTARHDALAVSEARQAVHHSPTSIDRARWLLALAVGMRQGEVLGLRWEDVHLDDPVPWVHVHQQVQRIPGQGLVVRPHTKSERPRVIPLADALAPVAEALRQHRQENGGVGFVFGGAKPISPRYDWGLWKDHLKACGLPSVPLHGARATAEQWMDEAGVPQQTRTDILGHATTQMTQAVYHRATLETMIVGLSKSRALD